jgi:DNA (cytosine-5)-methyltransferase 1
MSDIALISLFAGVGGFDLAAKNLGIPTIAAVEIDDHARGVIAHQFPETRTFIDVTKVSGKELLNGYTGRVILTGGFPCQDLSVAGKRAGLAGGRSGLFWEIVRIAEEIQPEILLLENVPGLLSSNGGRDMGTVIGALGNIGYRCGWRVLDAQHFGVPQRRRRVFIVAARNLGTESIAEILFECESSAGDSQASEPQGQGIAGTVATSTGNSSGINELARMRGFGDYENDGTFSACKARDYKDATDLVYKVTPSANQ